MRFPIPVIRQIARANDPLALPKRLESIRCQVSIFHRVGDIFVPEIVLKTSRVDAVVRDADKLPARPTSLPAATAQKSKSPNGASAEFHRLTVAANVLQLRRVAKSGDLLCHICQLPCIHERMIDPKVLQIGRQPHDGMN
jgi:hypothetical protein